MSKKNQNQPQATQPTPAVKPEAPIVETPKTQPPAEGKFDVPTPAAEPKKSHRYHKLLDEAKAFDLETRQIERDAQLALKKKLDERRDERKRVLARKQEAFLEFEAEQAKETAGSPLDAATPVDPPTQPEAPLTQQQPLPVPSDVPVPPAAFGRIDVVEADHGRD